MNDRNALWKNRAGPPRPARPMEEVIRDLVMALACHCAAEHHEAALKGDVACALPSTVDTVPISKTRDRSRTK